MTNEPLLDVDDLAIRFTTPTGMVEAVRNVSFSVSRGEMVGMVGESGSGKSITGLALLDLLPAEASVAGSIRFEGRDLTQLREREMQSLRGSRIAMIFQDPMTSLDPVFTVGQQIAAPLRIHQRLSRKAAKAAAIDLLGAVNISDPARRYSQYPHELSGGMRQRVMIAIALSCEPGLLIADEPTTALDVTVQAQILDLLRTVSQEHGTAVLLITHDLGVIAETCERAMVMYAGELVEEGAVEELLVAPRHPYTSGLLQAIPGPTAARGHVAAIPGRVPGLAELPEACRFAPRCIYAEPACDADRQRLEAVQDGHTVRCGRHGDLHLPGVADVASNYRP